MKPIGYGIQYLLRHHILRRRVPLICGLVLTNRCNLRCRHCKIPGRDDRHVPFEEVKQVVDSFYQQGGRCLYLQGGEPLLWRDAQYGIEHVVEYAHGVGYRTVVIYTNGTFPIETSADTVFVSMDGLRATHDRLRGTSFDRIMKNVQDTLHASLYVNFTINAYNKTELEEFFSFVDGVERIRGTFFYFHTPYYGRDDLYIEPADRGVILQQLLQCKKSYRILNSRAGLKSALRNDWKRPMDICTVYEHGATYRCCRYPNDPELCRNCGYLSYAEIDQTLKLKPSAIRSALEYF
jgi:MoaA/NifB/PqqE/SkfB family radical SAM enzyme